MMLSKGVGIRASRKPLSAYARHPGEVHGHFWYVPSVRKTGEYPHVLVDVNYWKTFVHAGLETAAGDRGSISLFGREGREHELIAEHVAGSETWVEVRGWGGSSTSGPPDRRGRTTIGWTASWAAPRRPACAASKRPARMPAPAANGNVTRRTTCGGRPDHPKRGDQVPRPARPRLSPLRLCALSGGLHPPHVGRARLATKAATASAAKGASVIRPGRQSRRLTGESPGE